MIERVAVAWQSPSGDARHSPKALSTMVRMGSEPVNDAVPRRQPQASGVAGSPAAPRGAEAARDRRAPADDSGVRRAMREWTWSSVRPGGYCSTSTM